MIPSRKSYNWKQKNSTSSTTRIHQHFCHRHINIGHGRRRRSLPDATYTHNATSAALVADNSSTPFTRFKENLEYTVVMPGELFHRTPLEGTCATSMMVAVTLGALLFMSALLVRCPSNLLKPDQENKKPVLEAL